MLGPRLAIGLMLLFIAATVTSGEISYINQMTGFRLFCGAYLLGNLAPVFAECGVRLTFEKDGDNFTRLFGVLLIATLIWAVIGLNRVDVDFIGGAAVGFVIYMFMIRFTIAEIVPGENVATVIKRTNKKSPTNDQLL